MREQSAPTGKVRRWIEACSIGAAFLISAVGFCWLVADYDGNFQSCELANRMIHSTGDDEPAGWQDFVRSFNWWALELEVPRARFLSYIAEVLNFRLRLFLWQYFTPHPTFSYIWLFSLASLGVLYKAAREFGFCRVAAAGAVVIYSSSLGFLSGFAHLDHPAKPMINVFIICAIYIFARIGRRAPDVLIVSKSPRALLLIALFMLAGFFFDETAIVAFAVIPVMFPLLFVPRRTIAAWRDRESLPRFAEFVCKGDLWIACLNAFVFCLPAVVYIAGLFTAIPMIGDLLGYQRYDFFSESNVHLEAPTGLGVESFPINFFSLLSPSILPEVNVVSHYHVNTWVVPLPVSWTNVAAAALFFIFLAICAWTCFRRQPALFVKTTIALAVVVVFATLFFYGATLKGTCTGFYYGNQFAIFFALLAGLLLNQTGKWLLPAGKIVLVALVVLQTLNTHRICTMSKGGGCYEDDLVVARRSFPEPMASAFPDIDGDQQNYPYEMQGSREEVVRIWNAWRRDRDSVENIDYPVSRPTYWVICELAQINKIERRTAADP